MAKTPGILDFTLGTNDLARACHFYDAVMSVLGLTRLPDPPKGWAGWGADGGVGFWLCQPFNGQAATTGNGAMVSFRAESPAQVRAFHSAALANGGTDEGPPGTRPQYDPAFYVAYVRDPDGHKLACAYLTYDATEDKG